MATKARLKQNTGSALKKRTQPIKSDSIDNCIYKLTSPAKVSITLDHLGTDRAQSSFKVVRNTLMDNKRANKIHFTVFVQCKDLNTGCDANIKKAEDIYKIDKNLVRLGIHSRPMTGKFKENNQLAFTSALYKGIKGATNSDYIALSFHGKNAGPVSNIKVIPSELQAFVRYSRTTKPGPTPDFDKPSQDITVVPNNATKEQAIKIVCENTRKKRPTVFFWHSHEFIKNTNQHQVFNWVVNKINEGTLKSVPFPR